MVPFENSLNLSKEEIDKFKSKFDLASNCWNWNKSTCRKGYGRFYARQRWWTASRISFVIYKGKIDYGKLVLHTCDNPPCVNPKHLYLGNEKDNANDCVNRNRNPLSNKSHCKNGHLLSGMNCGVYKSNNGNKYRRCKICYRTWLKNWRKRERPIR